MPLSGGGEQDEASAFKAYSARVEVEDEDDEDDDSEVEALNARRPPSATSSDGGEGEVYGYGDEGGEVCGFSDDDGRGSGDDGPEYESVEALKRALTQSGGSERERGESGDGEGLPDSGGGESDGEVCGFSDGGGGGFAGATLARLREELACVVCLGLLRDPLALRCGHALCRPCCRGLIVRSYPRRARCPICRAKFGAREDEETPTCVALESAARLLMTPSEAREASRFERARRAEQREAADALAAGDGGAIGRVLEPAVGSDPPLGWDRVPGFGRRVVVATRSSRREGRDPKGGEGLGMRVTLAARLDRDRLDLALEGRCALRVGVCVLRAEDDEADADGGLPWVLAEDEEDPLVAVDHGGRDLDLACLGRRATANLVRGECDFEDVDASAFAASDAEWLVVDVVDDDAGLEYRLAAKRTLDDFDDDDDSSSDGDEDEYDDRDGFIVPDDAPDEDEEDRSIGGYESPHDRESNASSEPFAFSDDGAGADAAGAADSDGAGDSDDDVGDSDGAGAPSGGQQKRRRIELSDSEGSG